MVWTVTSVTFLATVAALLAIIYAFSPGDMGIAARLSRLWHSPTPVQEATFPEKQKVRVRTALASIGKLVPVSTKQVSRTKLMMTRAGYRSPETLLAMQGAMVLLPACLLGLVYFTGFYRQNPVLILLSAGIAGYLIPELWLLWRVSRRQHQLRLALPDGLDLLVICVEAGLGLDQALMRVSQELRITHRELSDELQLVNLEMRVGKSRIEALRELAMRTGLDDIKALVGMLVQTERFGTSVAQSLRVHSDDLRTRRRQRAEEMSAKTTVKMVPPLVFFIFPALMVVILGPAVITLVRQLLPVLK